MKKKKKLYKTISEFIVFTLIMGFIVTELMGTTYATLSTGNPDAIVTINKDGHISQQGNLFGDELWYPDEKGRDGVIRIINNYRSTKLTNLGVSVKLNNFRDGYTETEVRQSFLNHMRLTIKKGRLLEFGDDSIINDISLADFLNGIALDENNQINISASSPLDLKYTMRMDEDAGNELQSMSAEVSFIIKTPITTNDDDDDDDDDKPIDDDDPDPIIEEPINIIPDLDGHWAHDCIMTLLEKGIIQGNEKGEIKPDDYITRAEAAVLVGKALKLEPKDTIIPKYVDPIPKWARGYVNITSDEEIFKGYPFGFFRPSNNITREEMIAVLDRAFELTLEDKSLELPFTDKDEIGYWAVEHVKSGYEDKVITGYPDNTYKPNNKITRAEAFTIICKLLKYHETHLQKVQ
jgi:hypothetical protein